MKLLIEVFPVTLVKDLRQRIYLKIWFLDNIILIKI